MNKFKTATQRLRAHLGRDAAGHELLDSVERVGNDIRTKLATTEESSRANSEQVEKLRQLINRLQAERDDYKSKVSDCENKIRSLESSNEILRRKINESNEGEKLSDDFGKENIHKMVKSLMRQFSRCPYPWDPKTYSFHDLISSFSTYNLTKLGMFTVVGSIMLGEVTITHGRNKRTGLCQENDDPNRDRSTDGVCALFMNWFVDDHTMKDEPLTNAGLADKIGQILYR